MNKKIIFRLLRLAPFGAGFHKASCLIAIVILGGLIIPVAQPVKAAGTSWYSPTWAYRQEVTISAAMASSDQSDFPALIKLTDENNPIFTKAQSDGDDLLFTTSDGVTKLSHEIEKFETTTGLRELVAWVKIPTLSASSDTVIYLYYGNSSCSSQENIADTWSNGFTLVQHLEENPSNGTAGHLDSTANSNNGTPYNFNGVAGSTTAGTGKIDGADEFGGSNDYLNCGSDSSLDFDITKDYTFSAWIKSATINYNPVISKLAGATFGINFYLSGNQIMLADDGGGDGATGNTTLTNGVWYYVAGTYRYIDDFNKIAEVYLNGNSDGSGSIGPASDNSSDVMIGYMNSDVEGQNYFNGTIDEARISDTERSESWLATSYRNQNDPDSYLTFGPEESIPGSGGVELVETGVSYGLLVLLSLISVSFLSLRLLFK